MFIALDVDRAANYAAIDARVDDMMRRGLLEEAHALLPHRDRNALRTVGYKELFLHFDGQLSREDAVALIKQHSRNYAKRQLTWLRREAHWRWVRPEEAMRVAVALAGHPRDSGSRPE
jgi:tRNA dimethylallyltransferase